MPVMRGLTIIAILASLWSPSAVQAQSLEVVATLQARPGNPAITRDGRILLSQQPLDGPQFKVVEVAKDGTIKPFPNAVWARDRLAAVLGIKVAADGTVWMLDMGAEQRAAKLVAWDTVADQLVREIEIPASARRSNSFLQDFVIDLSRGVIVIADMTTGNLEGDSHPALIVVDLETGAARRMLEDHASFKAEDRSVSVDGRGVATRRADGRVEEIRFGLNGIAIDPAGEWIYFGTVNGRTVWRVPAAAVADVGMSEAAIAVQIERYAEKRPSDGIAVDASGRVFISDVESSSIGIATPQGYTTLLSDERLSWPDSFSFGADGALYVTATQLHRHPDLNRGASTGTPPYYLFRVNAAAAGGRVFDIASEGKGLPGPGAAAIAERQLIAEADAGVRMFRVDRPLARHMHQRSDEYLYVVSGSASIIVAGEPARTIKTGDLIHYKRGVWHEVPQILQPPFVVMAFEVPPRAKNDVIFAPKE